MSRLTYSLDDSVLRSQLLDWKRTVNHSTRERIDQILNLVEFKPLVLLTVHTLKKAKVIQVAEELSVNEPIIGRYLDQLVEEDNLLGYELHGTEKIFFVLHESTKIVLDCASEPMKSGELNNHEQNGTLTKEPVNFYLNNTNENETASEGELSNLVKIRQLREKIEGLAPTGQKILHLLDDTPKSTKHLSQQIGCDNSTVSKYLKKFFDSGLADRETTSPYGAGRGEYFYFLNSVVSRVLLEEKNQLQMPVPPIELELEDDNHANKQNTAVPTSNEKICQGSEGIIMNRESFQQQSVGHSGDINVAERFDRIDKLDEFAALLDQVDKAEKELRTLLGSKAENLIARLKSKNL